MGPMEFNYPRAAVMSPHGLLFVVDKGARLQVFGPDGKWLRGWKMPAFSAGRPTGLGCDPQGNVYAADTHYSRVLVFNPQGDLLREIGERGTEPGRFMLPTDVAITNDGTMFVSEYGGNDRISRFDPQGNFELAFDGTENGGPRLSRPQSICLDPDGSLWVTDACNHRIVHFDPDGNILGTFGSLGDEPGQLRYPYGIDQLSDGSLIICEYGNSRVQRFSPDGQSIERWGKPGRAPGQLAYPWALAVDPDDRTYVIDSGNNRIQVVRW